MDLTTGAPRTPHHLVYEQLRWHSESIATGRFPASESIKECSSCAAALAIGIAVHSAILLHSSHCLYLAGHIISYVICTGSIVLEFAKCRAPGCS